MMNYSGNEVSASKLFARASCQSRQLSITVKNDFDQQQLTFEAKHSFLNILEHSFAHSFNLVNSIWEQANQTSAANVKFTIEKNLFL